MTNELDLVQEFSNLNQAKIESWGNLQIAYEDRWRQLKGFYENLMMSRLNEKVPNAERFPRHEIETRLPHRASLRIPAKMGLFFCYGDSYAPAQLINLSRGGIFLKSHVIASPGDALTLYMPNLGGGYELLFESPVDVVWTLPSFDDPCQMGLRFRELDQSTYDQLDAFVVSFLRQRLSKSNRLTERPSAPLDAPTRIASA